MIVTATYHANGGTGSVPAPATATVGQTITVTFSPAPTKSGKTFRGWSTNAAATSATYTSSGTKTFTASTDVTLYAVFT